MASDNLELDQLTGSENEKTNLINEIVQQFEDAMVENTTISMADASAIMSDAQFNRSNYFVITSSPFTGTHTLQIPERKKLFVIENQDTSEFTLSIQSGTSGGTSTIYAGQIVLFYSTGSGIERVAQDSSWLGVGATVGFAGTFTNAGGGRMNVSFKRGVGNMKYMGGAGLDAVGTAPALAVCTLPVNFRPSATVEFLVPTSVGTGTIRITSAGAVTVETGTVTGWISFDGISF